MACASDITFNRQARASISPCYITGPRGPAGLPLGNVAIVDSINGNDSTGSINGSPFLTIGAAVTAGAVATSTNPVMIWIMPGTYNLTSGIVLPSYCSMRGIATQSCFINYDSTSLSGTAILLTINDNSRLEDVSLSLTSTSTTQDLVGVYLAGTSSATSKLRSLTLKVNNSTIARSSTTNVYGVQSAGTGGLTNGIITPSMVSTNCLKALTITVSSNGLGKKRGIILTSSNCVTVRDANIYISSPPDLLSTGSYVGIETNDPAQVGIIQIRTTTVGSCFLTAGGNAVPFTYSDILQTTPSVAFAPGVTEAGIQLGPGTDLITKTAGGLSFTTILYPTVIFYGLKGASSFPNGGWVWPGTSIISAGSMPQSSTLGVVVPYYRCQQQLIVFGMSMSSSIPPNIVVAAINSIAFDSGTGHVKYTFASTPNSAIYYIGANFTVVGATDPGYNGERIVVNVVGNVVESDSTFSTGTTSTASALGSSIISQRITAIASTDAGTTVTYTLSTAPNALVFYTGTTLTVTGASTTAYNGSFVILSTTTSPNTIKVTSTATGATCTATATPTIASNLLTPTNITAITGNGTLTTYTFASTPNRDYFFPYGTIAVSGASAPTSGTFNGTFTILSVVGNLVSVINNAIGTATTANAVGYVYPVIIQQLATSTSAVSNGDGTVTYTLATNTASLYFVVGGVVTVAGVSPIAYNGTYLIKSITNVSTNVTTITVLCSATGAATGGDLTVYNNLVLAVCKNAVGGGGAQNFTGMFTTLVGENTAATSYNLSTTFNLGDRLSLYITYVGSLTTDITAQIDIL